MKRFYVPAVIAAYLGSAVAAYLIVAAFGPWSWVPVAIVFIGLDVTARDALHERWMGGRLVLNMLLLIAAGSVVSYLLNTSSRRVALASFCAFAASATTDTVVYHLLRHRSILVKVNGSNLASSIVDTTVFAPIAFGQMLWGTMLGAFAAKFGGGFFWSWVLREVHRRRSDVDPHRK